MVSTRALVNETCDEKRFKKSVNRALSQIRNGVHDGLFTARMGEENWGIAHRVLMPAFGPLSIRSMFDEMHDIASQLALKWARYGPESQITVTDDFTRLALDTLALCSMGFRFNSYYSPVLHPFIEAMGDFLVEAGNIAKDQKFASDIEILRGTAREVLESRKAGKTSDRRDLLTAMLEGVDPKTGKKMTDESIMDNLITFLIAGHETTSGLLSFAFYQLLKHPDAYQKAQQEVDGVVGKGQIKVDHLSKLPYLNGVLRETLRVNATIPLFTVEAFEDTLLAGKYPVKEGETIINLLAKSHLDPAVFGEDANEFKPERMMDDNFNRITKEFPNCWKPFGNGMRACIGRPFAWQEALLVMTMLLQNFNFVLDPNYSFGIKQTLTIKPKDMHMRAILRDGLTPTSLERRLAGLAEPEKAPEQAKSDKTAASSSSSSETGKPLTILYGSNSGTCEALAQRVASDAASHGFRATKIDCLDSANGSLPTDQPVVIITASYEGQPPDNAGHFVAWLEGQDKAAAPLKDVSYAVFGCGHKDWVQTFHRIPKLVDATLEQLGASRLADVGLTDASSGEVFTNFESWEDDVLWPALTSKYETTPTKTTTATTTTTTTGADDGSSKKTKGVDVVISNPRTSTLRQDVREATVTNTATLTGSAGEPKSTKKHIEIQIPDDMTYTAGDYLAVLPINPKESVYRAMRRFHLARDAHLSIKTDGPTSLPVDSSVPAHDLLSSYIELSQPATRRNLLALAEYAESEDVKAELSRLATDAYGDEISGKRVSVLDLLERHPSIDLPIGVFLSMMPPMRLHLLFAHGNPNKVTLTFSVLNEPSLSGQGPYIGVASSYLDSLAEGDSLHVAIRPSHAAFSLPTDAERTPMVCVAAGTGLAPFRGFIQERAAMIEAGRALAPALLFFGCRSPEHDDLYRAELDKWEALGAVSVRRAYSREPEKSEGCRHVQDRMWRDREELVDLWKRGAKAYVCGSRAVAESAKETIIKIKVEMEKAKGVDADEGDVKDWFEALRNIRYVTDVFD
ncbi:cytochrome P450 [Colletotrichum higginsianum]|nr:cytochrome P450 [Colletotrichum higginsianum]